jgi:small subunit ribosomal protein S7
MGRLTASKKMLAPDPKHGSILAGKFVNSMMWSGKKSVALNVFYDALDVIAEKVKDAESIDVFLQALENVKPNIEVRSKRVGGASYQVPMQVNKNRQLSLAIRWLLQSCREKKGRPMHEKLAAMTKRDNVHRMAEANKAFAHFAW